MSRLLFACFLVMQVFFVDGVADDASPVSGSETAPRDLHLFLLVGQSNMAGRGRLAAEDREPLPRIWKFDQSGEWVPAVDPLHFDKPGIVGVGLGRTFAQDYAQARPGVAVGLIPCAVGGSPISAWQPGGYHAQTKTHPYDDMLRRAKQALQSGTLKGILWHQGESDAKPELAAVYQQRLHALIARLRRELKAAEVPFLAGQMGQFKERPWDDAKRQVDQAHQRLPKKITRTAFVNSDELTHKGDKVHFDSRSYRELGHRYYKAYRSVVDGGKSAGRLFDIERLVAHSGFDGKQCWVHARVGLIPSPAVAGHKQAPLAVMTTQPLLLSGSDVFYALSATRSSDLGKTWGPLTRLESFARQRQPDGRQVTVCDFVPKWHQASRTLLGTGHTVWYENNHVMHVRPRATAYATYDVERHEWSKWQRLALPDEKKFKNSGSGSVQRVDFENGDILLPIYFKEPEQRQYSTTVCRCSFDGQKLQYLTHGSELTVDVQRGLYEPSLTRFRSRYFLTMRNDNDGYVSVSDDGLNFTPPKRWTFDDGTELGNYNTQQHWVTNRAALHLVYTRKGARNDHVFRHRAPLFIARVNPETLQVIRSTEEVLVPERGARLGNFGVVDVSPHETWVTVAEWMQPAGVEKYGSNNSIYVAKLHWKNASRRTP